MKKPTAYPRRILLAVSGLTPQIVTETVYALAVDAPEPFVPTEVHLLTTLEGAAHAKLMLLSAEPGWFHRLCREYRLREIAFPQENIHLLRSPAGDPLHDIRTAEENECAADCITEQVRNLTADDESALHVSLAGGRKTMGFYAGYALSLFGRPQDRLSHVLVENGFESAQGFFFPTRKQNVIASPGQTPLDAAKAKVVLAEIPFVRLRQELPNNLLEGSSSYSEVVRAAGAAIGPTEMVIDQAHGRVRAAGKIFSLRRSSLAMLSVFARRAVEGKASLPAPQKFVKDTEWGRRYLKELRKGVQHPEDMNEQTIHSLEGGMDGDQFSTYLSRLNKDLRIFLGPASQPFLIDGGGKRPRRYRLNLPAEAIRFEPISGE